jgi:hypothetical protein
MSGGRMSINSSRNLKDARIVVTIPPVQWFGGFDHRAAFILAAELERQFETSFYQFDTTPFIFPDLQGQKAALERLRDYQPDLAISLSNAGYSLACKIEDGGSTANVFLDLLGIPLMLLWDHGIFQFPSIVLRPSNDPGQSRGNAIREIREAINHPLAYHYPIDTGQVAEMKRIGLLEDRNVFPMPSLAYIPFVDHGREGRRSAYEQDLTFVGNVYLSDQGQKFSEQHSELTAYQHRIVKDPRALTVPAWTRLAALMDELPQDVRNATRLDYDQSFFWSFADRLICRSCNTQGRVDLLGAIDHPLAFYGAFADPNGIPLLRNLSSRLDYKGSVDFATGLPQIYNSSKILVDLTNAAFIRNCSTKPICCFAAGGFALFDRRPDAVAALGPDAERVTYGSHDELNQKIDYFLTRDGEREELARHLRETIAQKLQYGRAVYDACLAVFEEAPRSTSGRERLQRWLAARSYERPLGLPRKVLGVDLARVTISPDWGGARKLSATPLRVQTSSQDWGYSAQFQLKLGKPLVAAGEALWLEIVGRVSAGRVGISILDQAMNLLGESFAEEGTESFQIFFLLDPAVAVGLMLRSGGISSSVVEIERIAIVSDADATLLEEEVHGESRRSSSPLSGFITAVTSAIKGLRR